MMTALSGLVIGFIVGMVLNAFLLRNVPKADYLKNKNLRLKYGGLNWIIAFAGMAAALLLEKSNF